jgi:D-alanine-D-alanine ligase
MMAMTDQPSTIDKHTRIGVLCGGLSSERAVSLRSGQNCLNALHRLGYANAQLLDVDRTIARQLTEANIELAFLALHGPYGEDGCVQGLLEWLGIPYTGCRVAASAIAMDKALTKRLLADAGLPVLASTTISNTTPDLEKAEIISNWADYPVMVKPANGGSSVGMAKITIADDLPQAIENALAVDHTVMLEPVFEGVDATTGIIAIDGQPTVTPVLELRSKTGWYDETAKYTKGLTEFICPASFSPALTERLQEAALNAFNALGCHGVARVDAVVNPATEAFVLLEVNTIPGMTDVSDLPYQCQAMGMDYDTLVHHLLLSAINLSQPIVANPPANTSTNIKVGSHG